jgi:hypothetical protein
MGAGVSIPYSFTKDTLADADQVNANFQALAAKFTGGIYDGDVAAAADLDGNKISATAGKRVPATRLENNAAVDRVVASDAASPGADASRAISGDHMKLQTAAQQDRWLAAAGIRLDKLKITVHQVAFAFATPQATITSQGVNPSISFPKATYDLLAIYVKNLAITGLAASSTMEGAPRPVDVGANWAGGYVVSNASQTQNSAVSGTMVFVFIQKT